MTTFLTGATGFLGVNLVRLLVDRGERLRLLVRGNHSRMGLDSDLIEFVRGDVTDPDSVRKAMRGCELVYHLAAWVQVSPWGRGIAQRVNVDGTRNVCEAALENGVRRMVHTSSIATIATGTLSEPADEKNTWDLGKLRVPYYRTKREAERVVLTYVDRGLDVVMVNPTYLVGPWDVKPSAGRMLIHAAESRIGFESEVGGINFVDARHAAKGHILAMNLGRTGERYILGGENLSFAAFYARVASIAGFTGRRLVLPYASVYPFAAFGSLMGWLVPRWFRDINLSILRVGALKHYVSSCKAVTELGHEAVTIDQAIEDAIAWFSDKGYMKRKP